MGTKKSESPWPPGVAAPAQRALAAAGFSILNDLDGASESALAELHGMGPKALGILKATLEAQGMRLSP